MLKTIIKSTGFNDSERALARLCNETFLELWSYPSLWKPEGRKTPDGVGTELSDVLLVFGNSIVLFSDKDIKFNKDIDLNIAWKRWKSKSIDSSIKQLFGAMKWLKEHPSEIFLDPRCTEPFPFIDPCVKYRFHLIAVTRNTEESAENHFGMNSSGSLILSSFDKYPEEETPFIVRDNRSKHYVHVVDEKSLRLVLNELDTAPDFIKYLEDKERAVRHHRFSIIPGEEHFLGTYMLNKGPLIDKPLDHIIPKKSIKFDTIQLGEDGWPRYVNSGQQLSRKKLNEVSYFWDRLITIFSKAILGGYAPNPLKASSVMHEMALRILASETRQSRIGLSIAYQDKILKTPRHLRSSRVLSFSKEKKSLILLLLVPRPQGQSLEENREIRRAMMDAYGYAAKVKWPEINYITVIGTEPGIGEIRSEDLITFHIPELTDNELKETKIIMEAENILNDMRKIHITTKKPVDIKTKIPVKPVRSMMYSPKRNEICPCGSGKKYKKCCISRGDDIGMIYGTSVPSGSVPT